jgi:hypothetical protein
VVLDVGRRGPSVGGWFVRNFDREVRETIGGVVMDMAGWYADGESDEVECCPVVPARVVVLSAVCQVVGPLFRVSMDPRGLGESSAGLEGCESWVCCICATILRTSTTVGER